MYMHLSIYYLSDQMLSYIPLQAIICNFTLIPAVINTANYHISNIRWNFSPPPHPPPLNTLSFIIHLKCNFSRYYPPSPTPAPTNKKPSPTAAPTNKNPLPLLPPLKKYHFSFHCRLTTIFYNELPEVNFFPLSPCPTQATNKKYYHSWKKNPEDSPCNNEEWMGKSSTFCSCQFH